MSTASTNIRPPRRDSLNIRIKADERGLIDRAAELTGKTRTDFVLDAARRAAVEALNGPFAVCGRCQDLRQVRCRSRCAAGGQ